MTGPIRGEKSLFLLWEELSLSIVCNVASLATLVAKETLVRRYLDNFHLECANSVTYQVKTVLISSWKSNLQWLSIEYVCALSSLGCYLLPVS